MNSELVSVLIPTYNRARFITRAIDSALGQDHANLEVLVIDDGSKDETRELLQKTYGNDPRVRYFHKENGGVSSARNFGLRHCRGDFVSFLDSDDWWLPGKITLQLEALRRVPEAGMVWTEMQAVGPEGQILHPRYLRKMYSAYRFYPSPQDLFSKTLTLKTSEGEVPLYAGEIFSAMVLGNLVHTSTALLRRERLEKVGFFREEYRKGGEDYEFHLRTCREGPVAFVDAVKISYKIGMEDALTVPTNNVHMASAFVETLERTLLESRDRIVLPPGRLSACIADAYGWLGLASLSHGQNARGVRYLAKSLMEKPLQPALLKDAAATVARRILGR